MNTIQPFIFSAAVRHFWATREAQAERAVADQGRRREVTGGKQMDGFVDVLIALLVARGVERKHIYRGRDLALTETIQTGVELPGFYRATKKWDVVIVRERALLAAIELKSMVGPSFGNNFNNRVEEAVGSATDLWTAYRVGAFSPSPQPWLGYLFLLEDSPRSRASVKAVQPHFPVLPEFQETSYGKRAELLCLKLVRERLYNAACFLVADRLNAALPNNYAEPNPELLAEEFIIALLNHVAPV